MLGNRLASPVDQQDEFPDVKDLFPSEYIHVGGDEAVKTQWKESEEIQQMIRELDLDDEEELQAR